MRLKLTLVLLLANIAVFFVLWRLDRAASEPPPDKANLIPPILTNLDRLEISGRLLTDPAAPRVLEKTPAGKWMLTQPVQWPAAEFAVQNLIFQLQFLEQRTSFPVAHLADSGQTLASYGLDNPGLTVKLADRGNSAELFIGANTTLGNSVYVLNPEEKIIRVIDQDLLRSLLQPLSDLQDRRIFAVPYFEIRELSISGAPPPLPAASATPGGTTSASTTASGAGASVPMRVTLVKEGEQWRMEIPVNAAADSQLVGDIVSKLDVLTVERFLAPADQERSRQGLTSPSLKVTLKGNSSQTLLLGNPVPPPANLPPGTPPPPPQLYAQLEGVPLVFIVNAAPFEDLRDAQETLRERRFLAFDPAKVTEVTVRYSDREVRLRKKETGADPWQVLARDPGGAVVPFAADTAVMDRLLERLHALTAIHFASDDARPSEDDLRAYGLATGEPQWVVTLQTDKPLTVRLGVRTDTTPARYYAKVDGTPSIYEIGPAIRGQLNVNPLYFRDRTLDALPAAAQVNSLTLTDLVSGQPVAQYALTPEAPTWPQLLAAEKPEIRDAVLGLVEAVRKFQVATYLQTGFTNGYELDPGREELWRYKLEAQVSLPRADQAPALTQTRTYFFTNRLGGSMQIGGTPPPPEDATAPAGPPPMVFTLTQPMVDALYALTLARTPPAEVQEAQQQLDQPIDARPPGMQPTARPPAGASPAAPAPSPPAPAPAPPAAPPAPPAAATPAAAPMTNSSSSGGR